MTEKVSKAELAMGFLAILSILLVVLGNMMIAKGRFPLGVYAIDLFICVVFAWDFAKRLKSAESRHEFWKKSWYEPLAMIPAVALQALAGVPALSAGLRVLRLIRVARIVLVASRLKRSFSVADRFVERSQLLYLILVTAGIVIAAAFAVLALEFDAAGSQVRGISDALWWSLSTVTTVGYGDIVPMTPLGRIIGMVLMVVGIGVMATLISQVSATLVESRLARRRKPPRIESDVDISSLQSTVARVRDLSDTELAALLRDLVRLQAIGRHSDTR